MCGVCTRYVQKNVRATGECSLSATRSILSTSDGSTFHLRHYESVDGCHSYFADSLAMTGLFLNAMPQNLNFKQCWYTLQS